MKAIALSLLACLFFSACVREVVKEKPVERPGAPELASANGDRIGNGGGTWICKSDAGRIEWIELVDLFEARNEFNLTVPDLGEKWTYSELVDFKRAWLFQNIPDFFREVDPYLESVVSRAEFVRSDLEVVNDALHRIRPEAGACPGGKIEYVQIANFTGYGKVLINEALWTNPLFSANGKAALVFHEAIYQWLREKAKDTNSIRARAVTGILFSNLYPRTMRAELAKTLKYWGRSPFASDGKTETPSALFIQESSYFRGSALSWFDEANDEMSRDVVELSLDLPQAQEWRVTLWPTLHAGYPRYGDFGEGIVVKANPILTAGKTRWVGKAGFSFYSSDPALSRSPAKCAGEVLVEMEITGEKTMRALTRGPRLRKELRDNPTSATCEDFVESTELSVSSRVHPSDPFSKDE